MLKFTKNRKYKMKLVKESLNEFGKGNSPLETMGLGRTNEIHRIFARLNIPKDNYRIESDNTIFYEWSCNLAYREVPELPDNLIINGYLDLRYSTITKLPENLIVKGALALSGTAIKEIPNNTSLVSLYLLDCMNITELPDNLYFTESDNKILVNNSQKELIKWIVNSKYADKLEVNY